MRQLILLLLLHSAVALPIDKIDSLPPIDNDRLWPTDPDQILGFTGEEQESTVATVLPLPTVPTSTVPENIAELGVGALPKSVGRVATSKPEVSGETASNNNNNSIILEPAQPANIMSAINDFAKSPVLQDLMKFAQAFMGSGLNDAKKLSAGAPLVGADAVVVRNPAIMMSQDDAPLRTVLHSQMRGVRMMRDEPIPMKPQGGMAVESRGPAPISPTPQRPAPRVHTGDVVRSPVKTNGSILDQPWGSSLFGEKGALTALFKLADEQRRQKEEMAAMAAGAKLADHPTAPIAPPTGLPPTGLPLSGPAAPPGVPSDPIDIGTASHKIDGDFDLMKFFESIVSGSQGDQFAAGPEFPEFLGICNRLSCADIYKAIDQFRKSDFFSNFQTALSLVQDKKGWETIGKLMSNPELIAQFTGAGAGGAEGGEQGGNGIAEMFGKMMGGVPGGGDKKGPPVSKLSPEDGDFGTDMTEMETGEGGASLGGANLGGAGMPSTIEKETMPEIDFSVDSKKGGAGGGGGGEDYYGAVEQISENGDEEESVDVEQTIDVAPPPPPPVTEPPTSPKPIEAVAVAPGSKEDSLPPISFSIDGEGEEEMETFENVETVSKTVDVAPPKITETRFGNSRQKPSTVLVLGRTDAIMPTTSVTTPRATQVTVIEPTVTTTTTRRTTTTRATTTTRKPTTKNFRKDNDYYSMYYDN